MSCPHFPNWVGGAVHECASDHSTQLVEVGRLREASRTITELYEALSEWRRIHLLLANGPVGGSAIEDAMRETECALANARAEQVSA